VRSLQKQPIKLLTNGEEERQFIFMEDTVKNLIKMRKLGLKEVDMTNNEWIRIKELAKLITNRIGTTLELGEDKGYSVKIAADETSKQFSFETTIEQGIEKIIEKANIYLKTN